MAERDGRGPTRLRRRPSGELPPLPHEVNRAAIGWMVAFAFWAAVWVWVFLSDDPAIWITQRDLELMRPIVDRRSDWLTPSMQTVNEAGTHWAIPVVGWGALAASLLQRRIRHALLLILALSVVAGIVTLVSIEIGRPRPLGISQIGEWEGFAQPSRPMALLAAALTGAAVSLVPSARRRWCWVVAGVVLTLFGFAQVYTGVDHPSDVVVGATVGVAITHVLYWWIAPEAVFPIKRATGSSAHLDVGGARGEAIRAGLRDQLGIDVVDLRPIGLESSAGSTPLRIDTRDGQCLFAKLYARSHLRSDRSYKLWRTLLYGRLEDEERFNSVRRLVQHEDYMLHVMHRLGIPCAEPKGVVEITPEREYINVMEFVEDAIELDGIEVSDALIDDGMRIVRQLWDGGLAHRDIKPGNVMVQGDHLRLIDASFAQMRPSPWRQAVDLANMMLVLALGSSAERVYERARLQFDDDEIAEAFAASRGVTLPSQLRREVRRDGRELLERFRELAPERTPVAIQRWSIRRVGLMIWVLAVTAAVITVFVSNLGDIGLE